MHAFFTLGNNRRGLTQRGGHSTLTLACKKSGPKTYTCLIIWNTWLVNMKSKSNLTFNIAMDSMVCWKSSWNQIHNLTIFLFWRNVFTIKVMSGYCFRIMMVSGTTYIERHSKITSMNGETGYRWAGWVWQITSYSSKLQGN